MQFFAQGDRELEAGLPISPLMDRTKEGITKSQPGVRKGTVYGRLRKHTERACARFLVLQLYNRMQPVPELDCLFTPPFSFLICHAAVLHRCGAPDVPDVLLRLSQLPPHAGRSEGQLRIVRIPHVH